MEVIDFAPPLWDRNYSAFDEDIIFQSQVSECNPLIKWKPCSHKSDLLNHCVFTVGAPVSEVVQELLQLEGVLLELQGVMMLPACVTNQPDSNTHLPASGNFSVMSRHNTMCWTVCKAVVPRNSEHKSEEFMLIQCKQRIPSSQAMDIVELLFKQKFLSSLKSVSIIDEFPQAKYHSLDYEDTQSIFQLSTSGNPRENFPILHVPNVLEGSSAAIFSWCEIHRIDATISTVVHRAYHDREFIDDITRVLQASFGSLFEFTQHRDHLDKFIPSTKSITDRQKLMA